MRAAHTPRATEIRTIRGLESQIGGLQAQLRTERQKRAQAESELARAEQSLEMYQQTHGKVSPRRVGRGGKLTRETIRLHRAVR